MRDFLLSAIISFLICVVILPILIAGIRRLKAGQSILQYVEMHKSKDAPGLERCRFARQMAV